MMAEGAEKPEYFALVIDALGYNQEIQVQEHEYNDIASAREILGEVTSLEEKFYALCESYRDLRAFMFDINLEEMLYIRSSIPAIQGIRAQFSRRLLSFLSSVRLYIDSSYAHGKTITGVNATKDQILQLKQNRRSLSFDFMVMEFIRNYAQHRGFAVHRYSLGAHTTSPDAPKVYGCDFYFDAAQVSSGRIGEEDREALNAIISAGGSVYMNAAIHKYFSEICELHHDIRSLFATNRDSAIATVTKYQDLWLSQHPTDNFIALKVMKFKDGYGDDEFKRISLSKQIDEYRLFLESKLAVMNYMYNREASVI